MVCNSILDCFLHNMPLLIGASVTGITVFTTFYWNHRKDEKRKDVTLLVDFTKALSNVYSIGTDMEDLDKNTDLSIISRRAARYSRDYLNVLSKICYLTEIGYMKKEIGEYFTWSFNYGLTLKTWMLARGMPLGDFENHWRKFDEVVNKKSKKLQLDVMEMNQHVLPQPLITLTENNYTVFHPQSL